MENNYTNEKNVQILIALLKAHGIRKAVVSPGTTNIPLIAGMQKDPFFEIYSSVDERSAAYIACGLSAETADPIILSCTGATASRNYLSGLTEAYYRKLPILAITSMQAASRVGHHIAQIIDRSIMPKDVVKLSVALPIVKDEDDYWDCEIKVNRAILELKHNGGGPVHINLPTTYSGTYDTQELPAVRVIDRITFKDNFPELPKGKIAIFIGSHRTMSEAQVELIDRFCALYDAVVFCDHTSGYKGKYRVLYALVASQLQGEMGINSNPELLIHIGEVSGDYYSLSVKGKQVWRVSEDGEIRDTYRKLCYVFEMSELTFFKHYIFDTPAISDGYLHFCKEQLTDLYAKIPELPFSNIWIASRMAARIPENSTIHFAILNSLRSWNFFELPPSVSSASNVGGFGIDGGLSSLIGASFADKSKLYFAVIGDLAFFYDMNVIGNRHVGNNVRILLVNNGKGTEFRHFSHLAAHFGDDADELMAAAGHYGNKSRCLVKHYAQDLGFEYMSATNKQEFEQVYERFLLTDLTQCPMMFEVFTDNMEESAALEIMQNLKKTPKGALKSCIKQVVGEKGLKLIKEIMGK